MKDTILVLTNSFDGQHTDIVVSKLQNKGERVFRFDVDKITTGELAITVRGDKEHFGYVANYKGDTVRLDEIKSVWYRRPNYFAINSKDPIQKKYAEDEMTSFLEGLWLSTNQAFWMNAPLSLEAARKKVLQLQLAAELGFLIPRTIITNNPDEVWEFYNTCEDGIVFKALYREFLDYGEGKGFNIPTTLITARHLQKLNMVKKIPSQFQEFITKSAEVRVTIIGEGIFPILITPRDTPPVDVDWRHPSVMKKLSYTETYLPSPVGTFCRTVMRKLGLSFGAFDFIISKKGEWYFLEVNPNGQWYYCEEWAGVLISDAIVAILTLSPSR